MRGDDSHVGIDLKGDLSYSHRSLASHIGDTLEAGLDNGRFMPVGVAQGLTYVAEVPERVPYKVGIVLLALAAVAMMLLFLRRIGLGSLPALLVVAVAFALSLQFRATHDPVLGYAGTSQLSMIILFTGLWAYVRYLQGGSWRWYALALVMATALVMAYEANPPLVLTFLCLHLGRDPRRVRSWRAAAPFLAIGGAMTLMFMLARGAAETTPSGYETSLDLFTVAQVALRQALSGMPGLYFISGSQGLLGDPTRAEMLGAAWRAGLLAALLIVALLAVRGTSAARRREAPAGALPVAGVGFVLMSCSGLYISLAAQHQQLIGLGGGHLATFAGTMGFVLLAVAGWATWGPSIASSRLAIAGVALAAGGLAFASQYSNLRVVAIEKPGIEQRDLTRAALKEGVLAEVNPSTTIYVNSRDLGWAFGNLIFYGGTIDYLAYLQTGREYDIRPDGPLPTEPCPPAPAAFPVQDCATVSRTVATLAPRATRNGGSVILAEGMPAGRVDRVGPRRITVLAEGRSAEGPTPTVVGTRASGRSWTAKQSRWTREAAGDGWVRYETELTGTDRPLAWSLTDPRSPVDFTNTTNTPGQVVRMFGTKYLLP